MAGGHCPAVARTQVDKRPLRRKASSDFAKLKRISRISRALLARRSRIALENVYEELDSSLDPLIIRQFVKKEKAIKIDGKDVNIHPDF